MIARITCKIYFCYSLALSRSLVSPAPDDHRSACWDGNRCFIHRIQAETQWRGWASTVNLLILIKIFYALKFVYYMYKKPLLICVCFKRRKTLTINTLQLATITTTGDDKYFIDCIILIMRRQWTSGYLDLDVVVGYLKLSKIENCLMGKLKFYCQTYGVNCIKDILTDLLTDIELGILCKIINKIKINK